jgi:hypothetical protein
VFQLHPRFGSTLAHLSTKFLPLFLVIDYLFRDGHFVFTNTLDGGCLHLLFLRLHVLLGGLDFIIEIKSEG